MMFSTVIVSGPFSRLFALAAIALSVGGFATAQPATNRFMIGGDVGLNINWMSKGRVVRSHDPLAEVEPTVLGRGLGLSVGASLLCSVPLSNVTSAIVWTQIDEFDMSGHDTLRIPCIIYDSTRTVVKQVKTVVSEEYHLGTTSTVFGVGTEYRSNHFFASAGAGLGPYMTSSYRTNVRIITHSRDSCFFYPFQERVASVVIDQPLAGLNARLPIAIRLGLLIPVARAVFFAPSLGFNLDLMPIVESGATVNSIRPAVGMRYVP